MNWQESVARERLFYVTSKVLNNALLGVPREWLLEQMRLADVSFACDLDNCYICLTGVSRASYMLADENEKDYFESEYRIKDFLQVLMGKCHCGYEFFYHNVTKEQVILFTPDPDGCRPMQIAAAIHAFVTQEIQATLPTLYAQVGGLTTISGHISAYTQLGPAYEHLHMLKQCAFFHRKSALFTDEMLESLRQPLSFDKAQSTLNELERFAIAHEGKNALECLENLLLQEVKYCFDLGQAEEVCLMLRLLLHRWQNAYGFRLDEERISMLSCQRHLSVESLYQAAQQLFLEALERLEQAKAPLRQLTQETLDILHYQYARPITLAEVAGRLHVSAEHLSRVFRKDMQVSFSEYLLRIRMDAATRLLRETSCSVAEAAKRSGFSDAAYFHRIFHSYTGKTPCQYRSEQRVQAQQAESRSFISC